MDQLVYYFEQLQRPGITSLYIGGGTPSSIGLANSRDFFERLSSVLSLDKQLQTELEFTVEANPESLTRPLLDLYAASGVNRLSLGVQTFHEKYHSLIGRCGSPTQSRTALEMIGKSWKGGVNLDLMPNPALPWPCPSELGFRSEYNQSKQNKYI